LIVLQEYGSGPGQTGQVMGGRWKPLMYILKRSLFREIYSTCGVGGKCYCKNDSITLFNGYVLVELWNLDTEVVTVLKKEWITLFPGVGAIGTYVYALLFILEGFQHSNNKCNLCSKSFLYQDYFSIDTSWDNKTSILVISVFDVNHNELMGQNVLLWSLPKKLKGLKKNMDAVYIQSVTVDNTGKAEITLFARNTALFIVMTTQAQGRFDDNAFSMKSNSFKTVTFIPMINVQDRSRIIDLELLRGTLRIEHMGMYLT